VTVSLFDDVLIFPDEADLAATVPDGPATWIGGAMDQVAASMSPGWMVVLSDGHDTGDIDPVRAAADARQRGWRVAVVPVGQAAARTSVFVHAWSDADVVFPDQATTLNVTLHHTVPPGSPRNPLTL